MGPGDERSARDGQAGLVVPQFERKEPGPTKKQVRKAALREAASKAGHKKMSPLKAIRARCLDCVGHQVQEVRECPAVTCPSWPFRFGFNPWHVVKNSTAVQQAEKGGERE